MIEPISTKCKFCKLIIKNDKASEKIEAHIDCLQAMKEFHKKINFKRDDSSIEKVFIQYRPLGRGSQGGGFIERVLKDLGY